MASPAQINKLFLAWGQKFSKMAVEPMTTLQSNMFLHSVVESQQENPVPSEIRSLFQYKVAEGRMQTFNVEFDPWLLPVLVSMTDAIGDVVMFAMHLRWIDVVHGKRRHDLDELATSIWPMGFPTQEERHKMWEEQKGLKLGFSFDNLLDVVRRV